MLSIVSVAAAAYFALDKKDEFDDEDPRTKKWLTAFLISIIIAFLIVQPIAVRTHSTQNLNKLIPHNLFFQDLFRSFCE